MSSRAKHEYNHKMSELSSSESTFDISTTTTTFSSSIDSDTPAVFSVPSNIRNRKELLELINRLRDTGVQVYIDLPMIVVIGNQSAGKSSLIEAISGITLPRSAGTCTRCPTECKLSYSDSPWTCVVKLHFHTDSEGVPIPVRRVAFGPPITSKFAVEDRIRRAQCAILNPSKDSTQYLSKDDLSEENELSFSKNYVSLEISGRDLTDLSFVDLPGLIASVGAGGNERDIELVKSLVTSYIEKPSCVILLTVACETDFENQGAHHLAKSFDPHGERTVGVLTKPDRIPSGEEPRWLKIIRNETEPLVNNWYCVKQPSSQVLSKGITWEEARRQEKEYFTLTQPWCSLELEHHSQLRTSKLTEKLSLILSELIALRLPEIQDELVNAIRETEQKLSKLPRAPSNDPVGEVLQALDVFSRDLSSRLEGTPDKDGLLQSIRPYQRSFKHVICSTAPEFVPWERRKRREYKLFPKPKFLGNEEGVSEEDMKEGEEIGDDDGTEENDIEISNLEIETPDGSTKASPVTPAKGVHQGPHGKKMSRVDRNIYIDEVMEQAQSACTRELPDSYPFIVHRKFIKEFTEKWGKPTMELVDRVYAIVKADVEGLVDKHFASMGKGTAKQSVLMIVNDHLDAAVVRTRVKIEWLLSMEQVPMTLNTHYFSDYKDKFLAHYRVWRIDHNMYLKLKQSETTTVANVQSSPRSSRAVPLPTPQETQQAAMSRVLSGLSELGIPAKPMSLAKLLPPDSMEPALYIMASVRAYFQVAYKRFVDVIVMAIDDGIVLGLHNGIDKALRERLRVTQPDGYQHCKSMVEELVGIASARQEAQKRMERLQAARQELRKLA